jgi:hypothetical protein
LRAFSPASGKVFVAFIAAFASLASFPASTFRAFALSHAFGFVHGESLYGILL